MITCGYFNAENHDKKYYSDTVNSIISPLITNGVVSGFNPWKRLNSRTACISRGMIFIDGYWIYNDSDYIIPYDGSDLNDLPGMNRRDAILVYLDTLNRSAGVEVIKGKTVIGNNKFVDPVIPEQHDKKYFVLGYIDISGLGASGSYGRVDNWRIDVVNNVGTDLCPYAKNGGGKFVDISPFFVKYNVLWNEFMDGKALDITPYTADLEEYLADSETDFGTWRTTKTAQVNTWAAGVTGQLTPEQVSAFEAELASIRANYLLKADVTNNIFELDDPTKVPTSAIVYRAFEHVVPGGD